MWVRRSYITRMKHIVDLAVKVAYGPTALGRHLGITSQAISQWPHIPSRHVIKVEEVTGIHRSILRPDLYPPERAVA